MSGFRLRHWQVPKSVLAPEECQDAYETNTDRDRYVVTDGATQSVYARQWARLVAHETCGLDELSAESVMGALPRWREQWRAGLPDGPRPWNVARKLAEVGAYTTLVALELGRERAGSDRAFFNVLAVGDSCVFQVRDDEIVYAFPYDRPSDFDSGPTPTLGSLSRQGTPGLEPSLYRCVHRVRRRSRDRFLLASDAIAKYLLAEVGLGRVGVAAALPSPRSAQPGVHDWVDRQRRAGRLDDDDTTLAVVST